LTKKFVVQYFYTTTLSETATTSTQKNMKKNKIQSTTILALFAFVFCGLHSIAQDATTNDNKPTTIDFSPVFKYKKQAGSSAWQINAIGPLIELQSNSDNHLLAFPRPVFASFAKDSFETSSGFDLAWPLIAGRNRKDGRYLRALNYLHTRKKTSDTIKRSRDWLLPVLKKEIVQDCCLRDVTTG